MGRSHNTQYRFGPYTLDPDERRILGDGASPIELTAKAFDLLVLLVSKAEQLVTKDEILDAVWQEVSIAESNVTTTISMIRKALQEDSEHRYIETVPKKGYRFVAPVSVVSAPDCRGTDPGDQTLALPAPNEKRLLWIRSLWSPGDPRGDGNRLRGSAFPTPDDKRFRHSISEWHPS